MRPIENVANRLAKVDISYLHSMMPIFLAGDFVRVFEGTRFLFEERSARPKAKTRKTKTSRGDITLSLIKYPLGPQFALNG
jgi:hypothetical protein